MAVPVMDAYGFALLGTSGDAGLVLQQSFAAARKTANVWKAVDKQLVHSIAPFDSKRFQCIKPLVRKGIPYELRPTQWHHMSGAAVRQAAAGEGYYSSLADINGMPKHMLLLVTEELSPGIFLFRSHPLYKKQDGMDVVRRLLCAYSRHNPAGYFKGLAHIAGFLLIVMGLGREEQAFWVLAVLMEEKLFPYCKGQAAYGFKVESRVLDLLVAKKLPKVAAHLNKLETSSGAIIAPWFSNLFTTALPAEVTARIFDCLLLEGNKVMLRVGLALFKYYESSVCAASHPPQLCKVLESRAARLYNAQALLAAAFKGVGAMPTSTIQGLRCAAAAVVDAQLADQRRRLELAVCCTH